MAVSFEGVDFGYRRGRSVVRDLTITLAPGRTVLLGPNGAGKSTLLGLAASLLRPAAGRVLVGGLDPSRRGDRREYRRRVGWLPQRASAVHGLTAREQVAYAGWLKGLRRDDAWAASVEALDCVGLVDQAGQRAASLSGGQLRRLGIAQTLVHRADVLLLDEPFAGLDPTERARFRRVIEELDGDRDVVLSTHMVDDLEGAYDAVVVIDHGAVVYQGSVEGFLAAAPDGTPAHRRAEAAYTVVTARRMPVA